MPMRRSLLPATISIPCDGNVQQIVGPEPREACFASSVIRLSCSVTPWPGQLRRWDAFMKRTLLQGFGGFAYGALLATIGIAAANGGDGVMIPLYVFGS